MAALLAKRTIEEIRDANDIVETVGSYIPLKRAGSAYKALCPFHKEKTPSFSVNQQRQIFHCFGCGVGGDVFRFVMNFEGVDFMTAARILARRGGLKVEFEEDASPSGGPGKDLLYKLHEDVAAMYRRALLETKQAEDARQYLANRDIPETVVSDFAIGFAPRQADALTRWAAQKSYTPEQMIAAGMLSRTEGRSDYYDRFRGRLMFAIRDELGRIIGFSGRILEDRERAAKYVNSPETPLFRKSRVLYALDRARRPITEQRSAIVCEGQIDTIRCHLAGFTQAVAPQGTALTEDHARILRRYADDVVLVFDADQAGQDAALRSADVCLAAGLSVKTATLPSGQDPDTIIRQSGADAFRKLLDQAKPWLDFLIDTLETREDFNSESGLMRAARAVLEKVGQAPTEVQRSRLIQQAEARLPIQVEALWKDMVRTRRQKRPPSRQADAVDTAPVQHPPEERELAEVLVRDRQSLELVRQYLSIDSLIDPDCRRIVQTLLQHPQEAQADLMGMLGTVSDTCTNLAARIQATDTLFDEEWTPTRKTKNLILRIRRKQLEQQRREITRRAELAEAADQERLAVERSHLTMELERIRRGWEAACQMLELE